MAGDHARRCLAGCGRSLDGDLVGNRSNPGARDGVPAIVLFEPLGVATLHEAAAPYANPTIFLFLGGFIMALALERWNLHRRIALASRVDRAGTDGRRFIGGFMFVCAVLSMWMTNTSTTMMLLPIVFSVIATVIRNNVPELSTRRESETSRSRCCSGLAYSASIGGLATLVGTPPNARSMGHMAENYGIEISFARWMLVGIPVTGVLLPVAWFIQARYLYPVDIPANEAVRNASSQSSRRDLGR